MKKIYFSTIFAFIVLFFSSLPSTVLATNNISSVSVTPESTTPGATASYPLTFTTTTTLNSGTSLALLFFTATDSLPATSFSMGSSTYSSSTVTGTYTALTQGVSGGQISLSSTLTAGTYSVTITGVVNPGASGNFKIGMTDETDLQNATYTYTSSFTIDSETQTGSVASNAVSSVIWTPGSLVPEATTDHAFSITTSNDIPVTGTFSLYFGAAESDPSASAFSLAETTFESDTIVGQFSTRNDNSVGVLVLTQNLTAGTYTFTLKNVINGVAGSTSFFITSEVVSSTVAATYTVSESIMFMDLPETPAKLKVKNIEQRSATLKWGEVTGADTYTIQLVKKNGTKIKTWNNIASTKKKIKASQKLLKSEKTYKFRVKSCNNAGCSAFSKYKKFTAIAAETKK